MSSGGWPSVNEIATLLKKINGKFETKGVGIWGFTDIADANSSKRLLVDASGHLQIDVLAFPAAAALADAFANPTTTQLASMLMAYNAATWDRLRSFAGNADGVTAPTLGLLGVAGFQLVWNGSTFDRMIRNFPLTAKSAFNTAVTANTNIFATDYTVALDGFIRIFCSFAAAGKLSVKITRSATTKTIAMNRGTNLVASAGYAFDVPVKAADTVNVIYGATTTADYLELWEVNQAGG